MWVVSGYVGKGGVYQIRSVRSETREMSQGCDVILTPTPSSHTVAYIFGATVSRLSERVSNESQGFEFVGG